MIVVIGYIGNVVIWGVNVCISYNCVVIIGFECGSSSYVLIVVYGVGCIKLVFNFMCDDINYKWVVFWQGNVGYIVGFVGIIGRVQRSYIIVYKIIVYIEYVFDIVIGQAYVGIDGYVYLVQQF